MSTDPYLFVHYSDAQNEPARVVVPCLSFSFGWTCDTVDWGRSRRRFFYGERTSNDDEAPTQEELTALRAMAKEFDKRPSLWTTSDVAAFVEKSAPVETAIRFREAQIDGFALLHTDLKELRAELYAHLALGVRTRLEVRIKQLRAVDKSFAELTGPAGAPAELVSTDLSVMMVASAASMRLQQLMLSKTRFEASLVLFRTRPDENQNHYGRRNESIAPKDLPYFSPIFVRTLRNAFMSSYQESGSSENPMISASFACAVPSDILSHHFGLQDFDNLSPHLMSLCLPKGAFRDVPKERFDEHLEELMKSDPLALVSKQTVIFSEQSKRWELQQFGERIQWTRGTHLHFPAEFRAAARQMLLILRTEKNPVGQKLSHDIVSMILQALARHYVLSSPLDLFEFPKPIPKRDADDKKDE